MPLLLGIDIGTSGTKVILTDEDGCIVASATETYPLRTPHPNWAEQDPRDWWAATVAAIRGACGSGSAKAADIGCVGLTGQMHGLVLLDEEGGVLRPAILWCDQRTADECRRITGAVGSGIVKPGAISVTVGTSGVVFAYMDEPALDAEGRLHTFCHAVPGKWHVMGVTLGAGGSMRWFRDTLCEAEVAVGPVCWHRLL
ncbi:MAG: xylulokinase [Bacillota bacterium]|nr:xylulokinase [Bacillota bacterium]